MGVCCSRNEAAVEERLAEIFQAMHIQKMTYAEIEQMIINHLAKSGSDKMIDKKMAKELLSKLIDKSENNIYAEIHAEIFDFILLQLENIFSIYELLFFLFPFLNHINTKQSVQDFYLLLLNMNKNVLKTYQIRNDIYKYLRFCCIGISKHLTNYLNDEDLKNDLKQVLNDIYTQDNLLSKVDEIINSFTKSEEIIKNDIFISKYESFNTISIVNVRKTILSSFKK